jgi:hypothetical protein
MLSVIINLFRKRNDYQQRQGVTQVPLTSQDINLASRGLHKRLRALSWWETFIYRIRAEVKVWQSGRLTAKLKRKD